MRRVFHVLAVLVLALPFATPAWAQQLRIIRDAEVESLIHDFADPLLAAAGLADINRVYLVADRRFNAFVVEDGSMFINYGTILQSGSPSALKSVIAHEIGHLAGGHLVRLREQIETQGRLQVVALLLGVGAVAASAGSPNVGQISSMASAFVLASQSVGMNALMGYRRSEESAADAAGLRYLEQSGQSAHGMVEIMRELSNQQSINSTPYLSSHPLPSDRLAQIESAARRSPAWNRPEPAADVRRLALAKAKLTGFLDNQQTVLNTYPNSDKSVAARYARIISAYKNGGGLSALQAMPRLVAENPSNPYFQELLGQMYFETGNAAKGIGPLKRAVELAPDEPQIRVMYGQTLLEAGGQRNIEESVFQLSRAAREDHFSVRAYNLLSRAYAALGQPGNASLAAAEAALAAEDKPLALGLAQQAIRQLPGDTPEWRRADDILSLVQ